MPISQKRRRAIIAAHGGVCHYCGNADAAHVDHIVPRICGGSDLLTNLIAACLPCNLRKHRHRLPAEAESLALVAAAAAFPRVLEIEGGRPRGTLGYIAGSVITPAQCRAGRMMLDWTQQKLADAAEVGLVTLRQFEGENTARPQRGTIPAIKLAMELAGVEFTEECGVKPRRA
jgi:DNA-binding XRE family transcriptional regulator